MFFTLNRWKMLTVKTYLFILYTKKALQKHAFSFCNPWNTLPKKCFQFFVKMKSAPQACFQFVKMTSLWKRVFYIDTWKTLQKRVLKFWQHEKRFTSVFSVCQNYIAPKTCFSILWEKKPSKTYFSFFFQFFENVVFHLTTFFFNCNHFPPRLSDLGHRIIGFP